MKMFAAPCIYPIAVACAMAISFSASAQDKRSNAPQSKQETNESVVQKAPTPYPQEAKFFFDKPPYVHPKIILELSTWPSDSEEQIVSVNISESHGTNRFYEKIEVEEGHGNNVRLEFEKTEYFGIVKNLPTFSYELIGMLDSKIYVLGTLEWGGGSGFFRDLIFVRFECTFGLDTEFPDPYSKGEPQKNLTLVRPRVLITRVGELVLGDRWGGTLEASGETVSIGENHGKERGNWMDDIVGKHSFLVQAPAESTCNY